MKPPRVMVASYCHIPRLLFAECLMAIAALVVTMCLVLFHYLDEMVFAATE